MIHALNSLEHLKTLDGSLAMNDSDFASFTNDRELTRFWIRTSLSDKSAPKIAAMPRLEEFGSDNYRSVSDRTLEALGAAKNLRSLRIVWKNPENTSQLALDAIRSLPKLELLDISQQDALTDDVIRGLMPLHSLRELNIVQTSHGFDSRLNRRFGLSDKSLEYISECPQLEILDIGENEGFTDAGMAAISKISRLRSLIVRTTKIGDVGIKHIVQCRSLEVLNLEYTKITDEGVRMLEQLPRLTSLNLCKEDRITSESIQFISTISTLEKLNFVANRIDDGGLRQLCELPNLRELSISSYRASAEAQNEVRGRIPI